jgi:hypothetical protein
VSSLIFHTDEEQALVATDTLGVTSKGVPFLFTSKALYLPHLRTIVAGTGVGGFATDWWARINNRFVVRGIENLDCHTPAALRECWNAYRATYSVPESLTSTIYHFGISERTAKVAAYAYRSTNDFASEVLGYGTAVKPACTIRSGNLPEEIRTMMEEQRRLQATKPVTERLFIGGEIVVMHLTRQGCTTFVLSQFDDFSAQLEAALGNIQP